MCHTVINSHQQFLLNLLKCKYILFCSRNRPTSYASLDPSTVTYDSHIYTVSGQEQPAPELPQQRDRGTTEGWVQEKWWFLTNTRTLQNSIENVEKLFPRYFEATLRLL